MRHLRDWRVWLGLVISAVCLWLVLRDVSFADVARDLAKTNLALLLGASIPTYLYALYVRALRWRHLTDAIKPMTQGPLFRATAVGFMVNNVFPLRIGEVVRAWYLARETQSSGAAVLATVLLERVVDSLVFFAMAAALLGYYGSRLGGIDAWVVVPPLVLVLVLPLMFVAVLRVAPERIIALVRALGRPLLRESATLRLEGLVRHFSQGLGSLRGGTHLFWIAFHSGYLWLVVSPIPFLVGLVALDVDLGSAGRALGASYATMVMVGIFIAVPSAPGFFGPYHAACVLALSLFGVPKATAVAAGTAVHITFWISVTAFGLAVLRTRRTSLGELGLASASERKDPFADRR